MNHEIKFRVWDKEEKIFIYRNSNKRWHNEGDSEFLVGLDGSIHDRFGCRLSNYSNIENGDFILQQFTGLKDKNDKDIYEGDIIKLIDNSIGEVKYNISIAAYIFVGKLKRDDIDFEFTSLSYVRPTDSEIVGNIFENSELIKY